VQFLKEDIDLFGRDDLAATELGNAMLQARNLFLGEIGEGGELFFEPRGDSIDDVIFLGPSGTLSGSLEFGIKFFGNL
jgi:hypothetical protein